MERIRAAVDAEQALALAEFASRREDGAARTSRAACAGDEIGLALRIAGRTADCRIDTSVELCERMPAAVRAMRAGGLTLAKARVLLEETANLDAAAAAAVADQLLGAAPEMTPGGLRRRARRMVVGVDADAAAKRRAAAERGRRVRLYPDADGMATICAHLGAPDAVAIFSRIDQIARAGKAAGDARTLDQLRADALVDILYGGAGPAGRPLVQMLLPADRVRAGRAGADRTSADRAGADAAGETAPAELVGYGPIDTTWRWHWRRPRVGSDCSPIRSPVRSSTWAARATGRRRASRTWSGRGTGAAASPAAWCRPPGATSTTGTGGPTAARRRRPI
ncbi:MAG: DUF222 domain-containing protein [Mycobacteriales bacterium]